MQVRGRFWSLAGRQGRPGNQSTHKLRVPSYF